MGAGHVVRIHCDLLRQRFEPAGAREEPPLGILQSMEEKIGRLSQAEVDRLQKIAEKQKVGGELTLQEASFLERTGIGTAQAAARFRQEGQARGSSELLAAFGEDRSLNQAKQAMRDAINIQGEGAKEIREQLEKNIKSQKEFVDELGKGLAKIAVSKDLVDSVLKKMEDEAQARHKDQLQNRNLS